MRAVVSTPRASPSSTSTSTTLRQPPSPSTAPNTRLSRSDTSHDVSPHKFRLNLVFIAGMERADLEGQGDVPRGQVCHSQTVAGAQVPAVLLLIVRRRRRRLSDQSAVRKEGFFPGIEVTKDRPFYSHHYLPVICSMSLPRVCCERAGDAHAVVVATCVKQL